jgi:predicted RNA binding protein YcfA (HicA-like mRNA interferase family)
MGKRGRKIPPLTFDDFDRVLRADGWFPVDGTKHENYKHPTKHGKVSLDKKWKNVRVGDWVWRSVVVDQASMTKREFETLYWETR